MKSATTPHAVKNATTNPTANTAHSVAESAKPAFNSEPPDAAIIIGIAIKNENSAATGRAAPSSIAPIIVAAERETPGIMAIH